MPNVADPFELYTTIYNTKKTCLKRIFSVPAWVGLTSFRLSHALLRLPSGKKTLSAKLDKFHTCSMASHRFSAS